MENIELTQAEREARNKYMKEWRANNKDKIKQYQKSYWNKKAKEMEAEERAN